MSTNETENEQLETLLQKGLAHIKEQSFTAALKEFTAAIALAPQDTRPYGYRAQLLAAMGQQEPALADCAKVLRLDPRQPDAWYLMGTLFQKRGDEAKAADCLRRAAEYGHTAVVFPPVAPDETADMPEPKPEPEPTRPGRIALSLPPAPDLPVGELFDTALLSLSHAQYEDAYVNFSHVLGKQPNTQQTAEAYAYRGWACYQLGYTEDAHADFTLAVTQNSHSIEPYLQRGRVHLLEKEYQDAEDNFRHAGEHALPHDVRPALWLGQVALAQARAEQSRHYFRRVLDIEPSNATAQKLFDKAGALAMGLTPLNVSGASETAEVTPTDTAVLANPLALARETLGEFALVHGGDAEEVEITKKRSLFNTKRIKKTRLNWRIREEDTAVVLDLVPQPRASIFVTPTAANFAVRLVEPLSSGEQVEVVNTAVPLTQSALATWLYDLLEKGLLAVDQGRLRYTGRPVS